jgi:hypothetical protein
MKALFLPLLALLCLAACKKPATEASAPLVYTDSVIYLRNVAGEQIIYPNVAQSGTYTAFPEGLEIDERSGAINVSRSETGLRYRITFTGADGAVSQTSVVLSGVNYIDRYFNLAAGDSILRPVYNADPARLLPAAAFDESRLASGQGCAVATGSGSINLAKTLRDGFLGNNPQNDACKEVEIAYKINDASQGAPNKIKVKIYFYNSASDVSSEIRETLREREGMILGAATGPAAGASTTQATARAKPRPPCIIIIAH